MSPLTLRLAASVCFDFPDEAAAWPVSLVPSLEVSHQVDLRLSGVHPGAPRSPPEALDPGRFRCVEARARGPSGHSIYP